jgi:hypothetical protein
MKIQDLILPSGSKVKYIFAKTDVLSSESQLDEIKELQDFEIHGPLTEEMNANSPRYKEFLLSRYLLLQLFKDFKKNGARGGLSFSLSHTMNVALVAAMPNFTSSGHSLAAGLGVDLEHKDRKISDAAFARIVIEKNEKAILPLQLWCLKEAAFKAHPNNQTQNDGLLLSDFILQSNGQIKCQVTGQVFEYATLSEENYLLNFASLLSG